MLPGYDEYLLGYKDRSAVLEPAHAPRLAPGGNGVFAPMLVVDGAIAGTWKRTIKRDGIELSLSPFFPIGNLRERVGEAARRYGEFVGMPLRAEVDVFYAGE